MLHVRTSDWRVAWHHAGPFSLERPQLGRAAALEKPMLPRVMMRQEKYDQRLGGTWEGYLLLSGASRTSIWTPAGTVMHWFNRDWPMRYHSLQHFWPERWYRSEERRV